MYLDQSFEQLQELQQHACLYCRVRPLSVHCMTKAKIEKICLDTHTMTSHSPLLLPFRVHASVPRLPVSWDDHPHHVVSEQNEQHLQAKSCEFGMGRLVLAFDSLICICKCQLKNHLLFQLNFSLLLIMFCHPPLPLTYLSVDSQTPQQSTLNPKLFQPSSLLPSQFSPIPSCPTSSLGDIGTPPGGRPCEWLWGFGSEGR